MVEEASHRLGGLPFAYEDLEVFVGPSVNVGRRTLRGEPKEHSQFLGVKLGWSPRSGRGVGPGVGP